jgi:hypothetical protein
VPQVLAGDGIEGRVEFIGSGHGGPGWTGRRAGSSVFARTARAAI